MLELRDAVAGYGAAPIVRGVSLHVAKGETVALLGPNGAGKSTLLAAITGTIRMRQGSIRFDGAELIRQPSRAIVASGLVLVPEGRLIIAPFTVEDNLRLGAVRLRPGHTLAERYDYVYGLFPRLNERRRQMAGSLSGGEQQMLAIGRALMSAPRMLLLDEPFLGLAPALIVEIRRALEELQTHGLTILLVEQKLRRDGSDRILRRIGKDRGIEFRKPLTNVVRLAIESRRLGESDLGLPGRVFRVGPSRKPGHPAFDRTEMLLPHRSRSETHPLQFGPAQQQPCAYQQLFQLDGRQRFNAGSPPANTIAEPFRQFLLCGRQPGDGIGKGGIGLRGMRRR